MIYCSTQSMYISRVQLPVPAVPVSWSAVVVCYTRWRSDNRDASQASNVAPERVGTAAMHLGYRRVPETFPFPFPNLERFFSSLKKTIVLYLVKNFETFMLIFTSGLRRVFFKKMILYIRFTDNPFNTEFLI